MQPLITIFCAFSRKWAIDKWIEDFSAVEHDPASTNVCFIVDGDEPYIETKLKQYFGAGGYRSFQLKSNKHWSPNEIKIEIRRMRVADLHNQAKAMVAKTDGDIIIGLEDDTVMTNLRSFAQLYTHIVDNHSIGFVEGVQCGRWGAKIIGAWIANDLYNPTRIETMLPSEAGYIKTITGGGMYGFATRRNLYLNCEQYTSSNQPWGPDVNFGFYIRQQGYHCIIDWNIIFGHNDHGHIIWPDKGKDPLSKVIFEKNTLTGRWDRTDYEDTRSNN